MGVPEYLIAVFLAVLFLAAAGVALAVVWTVIRSAVAAGVRDANRKR
jgi:hypothetical protein